MPATSGAQQKLMGMVHAFQKGELSSPSAKVKEVAEHIKPQAAKDFASTKRKNLPEHSHKKKAAYIAAFVKRASEYGLTSGEAIDLCNRAVDFDKMAELNLTFKDFSAQDFVSGFLKSAMDSGLKFEPAVELLKASIDLESLLPFLAPSLNAGYKATAPIRSAASAAFSGVNDVGDALAKNDTIRNWVPSSVLHPEESLMAAKNKATGLATGATDKLKALFASKPKAGVPAAPPPSALTSFTEHPIDYLTEQFNELPAWGKATAGAGIGIPAGMALYHLLNSPESEKKEEKK